MSLNQTSLHNILSRVANRAVGQQGQVAISQTISSAQAKPYQQTAAPIDGTLHTFTVGVDGWADDAGWVWG